MAFKPKATWLALATVLAALTGTASAQDYSFGWNPRSGDVWVDDHLSDVNRYGSRYRESFIDEIVRYHGAPRDLVSDLLVQRRWAPGDVYYACAIASIIGRPCRYVVEEWDRDHDQGWGNVAQRLGIKPGSAEFHRLKRGFVPTYDRWGRPIEIDADLHGDFPNRAKPARKHDTAGAQRARDGDGSDRVQGTGGKGHGNQGAGDKGQGNSGKGNQDKGNKGNGKG